MNFRSTLKLKPLIVAPLLAAMLCGAFSGRAAQQKPAAEDKADQELNKAYRKVTGLLKGHPEAKAKLTQAQLAWIKYRDLDASFTATLPGTKPQAPGIERLRDRVATVTQERTWLLQRMFVNLPESIKKSLRPPWPAVIRTIRFDKEFRRVAEEKLPPGVLRNDQVQLQLGNEIYILEIDLNQDGVKEIIGCYGGGNGGLTYIVHQKKRGKFVNIGEIFGNTLNLLARKNGYYQIGTSSKSGAGDYNMTIYQYVKGAYRLARSDQFNQYRGYLSTYPENK